MTKQFSLKKLETLLVILCKIRFDILRRLGVDHERDGQTDGQTEPRLEQ